MKLEARRAVMLLLLNAFMPAFGGEGPWLARVVKLDVSAGTVEVMPELGEDREPRILIIGGDSRMDALVPGQLVRIWPDATSSEGGDGAAYSRATLSPVDSLGGGRDRTGVRARLGRGGGGHGGR